MMGITDILTKEELSILNTLLNKISEQTTKEMTIESVRYNGHHIRFKKPVSYEYLNDMADEANNYFAIFGRNKDKMAYGDYFRKGFKAGYHKAMEE